jgi:hypothetical protein
VQAWNLFRPLLTGGRWPIKMMKQSIPILVVAGLVAAIVWRLELEFHGWKGLDWLGYFHWAIPVGVLLFLSWLFVYCPITSPVKRLLLVCVTGFVAVVWFLVVEFSLYYYFNGGPSAFIRFLAVGEMRYRIYMNLIYAVIPLTPLIFATVLCLFGLKLKIRQLWTAVLMYILACPISIIILAVLQHRGGADALHTIKSGVIIPFLVVGLGILVPRKREGPTKQWSRRREDCGFS